MKDLRRLTGLVVMLGVIMMGASSARAGLVMSDLNNTDTCTEINEKKDDNNVDHGIIVVGLIQIFGKGLVESVIGKSETRVDCGVIVVG